MVFGSQNSLLGSERSELPLFYHVAGPSVRLSVCLSVLFTVSAKRIDQITCGFFVDTVVLASSAVCILDYSPTSGTLRNPGIIRFFMHKIHIKRNKTKIYIECRVIDDGESESEVRFS